MPRQLLVSLSSFGADLALRDGQAPLLRLCAEAGADGVEVRSELLRGETGELAELGALARDLELERVYSHHEPLWSHAGALDAAAFERARDGARQLGARRFKMSLGPHYGARGERGAEAIEQLRPALAADDALELVVENDQTVGGTLPPLADFLGAARRAGVAIGMTFDLGNWHWLGEDPAEAARVLAPHVVYVHCKGVQRQPGKWVAVPLAESSVPWRSTLRLLPGDVPHAIEYPLQGDDLQAVTRAELALIRGL